MCVEAAEAAAMVAAAALAVAVAKTTEESWWAHHPPPPYDGRPVACTWDRCRSLRAIGPRTCCGTCGHSGGLCARLAPTSWFLGTHHTCREGCCPGRTSSARCADSSPPGVRRLYGGLHDRPCPPPDAIAEAGPKARSPHRLTGDGSSTKWTRLARRMLLRWVGSRTRALRLKHQPRCSPRCHPTLDAGHFASLGRAGPRAAPRERPAKTVYLLYVASFRRRWDHHVHGKRSTRYHFREKQSTRYHFREKQSTRYHFREKQSTRYHETTALVPCPPPSSRMRFERLRVVGRIRVKQMVPPCAYARAP